MDDTSGQSMEMQWQYLLDVAEWIAQDTGALCADLISSHSEFIFSISTEGEKVSTTYPLEKTFHAYSLSLSLSG